MKESSLSAYQHQLVQRIAALNADLEESGLEAKGLAVYRNNLWMTARRALALTYPVIAKMLGEQALKILAQRLLQRALPATGDWAEWGEDLPALLRESELGETLPFIADVAVLEWHVHQAGRTQQKGLQASSFQWLQQSPLRCLFFKMQKGVVVLQSRFPIAELWQAHQPWNPEFNPDTTTLQDILEQADTSNCVLITSQELRVIQQDEYLWYRDVLRGLSLQELTQNYPDFNSADWLQKAVAQNLVITLLKREILGDLKHVAE